jgi:hypothetical protein
MHASSNTFSNVETNQKILCFIAFFGEPTDVEGLFYRHFDAMAEDEIQVTERQQIKVTHL